MYDKYIKYPSIDYLSEDKGILDRELKVFEKLDGANCQFTMSREGKIIAGSIAKPIKERKSKSALTWKGDFLDWVQNEIKRDLYRNVVKRGYNENRFFASVLDPRYVFFGEWLSTHTKTYPSEYSDDFYLIDVLDLERGENGRFVDYDEAKEIVEDYGLDLNTVETIHEGKLDEEKVEELMEGSNYGVERKEGIVMKDYTVEGDYTDQIEGFAKHVDPEFTVMRENISYHDSILIERIARDYVEENYEEVRNFLENSKNMSQIPGKNEKVNDIVKEIEDRGVVESHFDSNEKNFDLYNKRLRQALTVFIKEKEGIL